MHKEKKGRGYSLGSEVIEERWSSGRTNSLTAQGSYIKSIKLRRRRCRYIGGGSTAGMQEIGGGDRDLRGRVGGLVTKCLRLKKRKRLGTEREREKNVGKISQRVGGWGREKVLDRPPNTCSIR